MTAATKVAQDPELIARLQSEVSRNPGAYRLRLAIIAVAGDLALMVTQILPVALPIVIGALWMNVVTFYWLSGAAILLFAWMVRPSFRFSDRELAPEEAPALRKELASLKEKLRARGRMQVCLDESFNASAAESRGIFGLLGTRSALTLGVPLLFVLDRRQVLAIIGHEFGHFSRRHGRLGNWLYRARVGWMMYAEQVADSDSSFDQAAAWYARHFVPFFSARSFVHSRQCEYEADADAAAACGSDIVATALTRIMVLDRVWTEVLPRRIADWQLQSPEPPADFYERFARLCRKCPSSDMQEWLAKELAAPSGWLDTHPSLSERLSSLKEPPHLGAADNCAGEQLLGESWPKILAEFNARWARKARPGWLLEHLRRKHIAHPLLSADAAAVQSWPLEKRLARARTLRSTDPAAGLLALRELHAESPGHRHIRFSYGAALLAEDEEAGVELMEALAREDPAFRVQAFSHAVAYFERMGDKQRIERWSAWLKRAAENLATCISGFVDRAETAGARPSSLSAAEQALIAEATELDPCVKRRWLLEGTNELPVAQDRPPVPLVLHLLVLAIDPEEVARHGQSEDTIARRYEDLLATLAPADQVAVVRTYFTTETVPPAFG
jgi:Zn-dependent protease with chaperone function